jgi:hypothetical protein
MADDIGMAIEDLLQGLCASSKVRNQKLNPASGKLCTNFFYARDEIGCSPIVQVISGNGCDNDIMQIDHSDGLDKICRLVIIGLVGNVVGYIAIQTIPGAGISKNEKCGCPFAETFC